MKRLLAICAILATCSIAVPEPAIEKARQICEPYGGLEQVNAYQNQYGNVLAFVCANGDKHTLLPLPLPTKTEQ